MNVDYSMPGGKMRRVRDLAKEYTLIQIVHLDKYGRTGARGRAIRMYRLSFSNIEDVYLTPMEFRMIKDVQFNQEELRDV